MSIMPDKRLSLLLLLTIIAAINCDNGDNDGCADDVTCAETQIRNFVDEVDRERKVKLLGDFLVIEKIGEDPTSRRNLEENIVGFLTNHVIKVKLPTDEDSAVKAFEEARRSKLKKLILPLILLLKLKAAIIIPAVLSAIALIAFKGLGASIVALTLAGATALRSVLEHHHVSPKVTYEVVPQISPHWSRSGVDGIEAYPIPGYHTII